MFCKAKLPVMLHAAKTKAQFYGKKIIKKSMLALMANISGV